MKMVSRRRTPRLNLTIGSSNHIYLWQTLHEEYFIISVWAAQRIYEVLWRYSVL